MADGSANGNWSDGDVGVGHGANGDLHLRERSQSLCGRENAWAPDWTRLECRLERLTWIMRKRRSLADWEDQDQYFETDA